MKAQYRPDYLRDYLLHYENAVEGELLLEGQKRPVVPMMAVVTCREFPNNKELQTIRKVIMHNVLERAKAKDSAPVPKDPKL